MQRAVGHNVRRKDSRAKVTGASRYIDDLRPPGLLFGATVRSPIAHGRITARRVPRRPGLVSADFRDVPGRNLVALIAEDQPCLAEAVVRHVAEPVVLLAHADREGLAAAVAAVVIDYAAQTPVFDPVSSPHSFKDIAIDKGDLDQGLRDAAIVVEGEYRTAHQEQLYIETNGVIAVPWLGALDAPARDRTPGMTVYGSLQCPYYVHKALVVAAGTAARAAVRVVQTETGGGFGGKEDYPSCWRVTRRSSRARPGRPVKMIYDRVEDLLATTKRHPSIVRHRTGVDARRPADGDGHRRRDRRRRLLHAERRWCCRAA